MAMANGQWFLGCFASIFFVLVVLLCARAVPARRSVPGQMFDRILCGRCVRRFAGLPVASPLQCHRETRVRGARRHFLN